MHDHLDAIGAVDPVGLRTDPDEIDALVALGELDGARAVLEQLERRHATIPRPWTAVALPRARALVSAARGDPTAGLQALEELDLDGAERVPLEHARTLLAKGRLHRRLKQRRIAGEVIREALDRFVGLGAVTWEQQARAELARTGVRRAAPGELTASELRVAELAATGLTNREVAKVAFMSTKTVEANLVARVPQARHQLARGARSAHDSSQDSRARRAAGVGKRPIRRRSCRPRVDAMKTRETYLVEHYRPGASFDDLDSAVREVQLAAAEMARRRRPVRCVHYTIVPSDEALLALFEATSEELVRDVFAHAGIPFERITGAVSLDAAIDSLASPKGAR